MNLFLRLLNMLRMHYLMRKGYSSYYVSSFSKELKEAYKNSNLPKKEKKWAFKRGFYPWHIAQYGLTEENYKNVISDRDYFYLYPLNNQYSKWIDDKLTMKYVLAPFDRFLPRYYFHLMKDRGVMKLMDCPADCTPDYDGIIYLLREKKALAAKLVAGTYGIGFYKLEAAETVFLVNGQEKNEEEFRKFLGSLNDYIITEYVEMHPALKKINPMALNTIRVTLINENGNDPIIPFAFMRIGTNKSGSVDNTGHGGMLCRVDVDTGRFYDGEVLVNHVYIKSPNHPDTNEPIEGILPNWDLIKSTLLDVARYFPQLRWLGFDIGITEDGFRIIEINSHQGLHKAHEYPPEVTNFLFSELEKKKKRYHLK